MRIPLEIMSLVIEEVEDIQSFVGLSQTSKPLQIEAERHLYRSLTGGDGTKRYKCLSSIKKCPRRAKYVRVYHDHSVAHKQHRSMWKLIEKTLPLMVNLKDLAFRYIIGGGPHTVIFPRKYAPRLEKFTWSVNASSDYYEERNGRPFVAQALKFLEGQTQLKYLHWQPSPYAEPNPKPSTLTLVPHLDTLIGDIETIQTYLPGRDSITTLQLFTGLGTRSFGRHFLGETFDRLSTQLKRLKYLSIQPLSERFWVGYDEFYHYGILRHIAPYLHSLETLRIPSLTELEIVSCSMKKCFSNLTSLS